MTKVLLYSSGMDSWIIDKLWKPDIKLFVDMGTYGNKGEKFMLPKDVMVEKLDIGRFELPEKNFLLPLRNLYLCMMAMAYGDVICLGSVKNDVNIDNSEEFCKLTSDLLTYLSPQIYEKRIPISVVIPFKDFTKTQLLKLYESAGGDLKEAFKMSNSCYTPTINGDECKKCSSCLKKIQAFSEAGYKFER